MRNKLVGQIALLTFQMINRWFCVGYSMYFRICLTLFTILTCVVQCSKTLTSNASNYLKCGLELSLFLNNQAVMLKTRYTDAVVLCLAILKLASSHIPNTLSDANSNDVMWCNKQTLLWEPSHVLYSNSENLPQHTQHLSIFQCKANKEHLCQSVLYLLLKLTN